MTAIGPRWWGEFEAVSFRGPAAAGPDQQALDIRRTGLTDVLPLRRAVLRDGRDDEPARLADDDAPTTLHLGAFRPGQDAALGCLSLLAEQAITDELQLRLRMMAVDPQVRHEGIGTRLVLTAQQLAATARVGIWAAARDSALPFYRRLGFEAVGERYVGPMGLPHHRICWNS